MGRAATRSDAVRFVLFAVVCMMVVSVAGSGGTAHLQSALPEGTGGDGPDAREAGSCLAGMDALDESFAPVFLPLSRTGLISPYGTRFPDSAHLPGIFRPPNS